MGIHLVCDACGLDMELETPTHLGNITVPKYSGLATDSRAAFYVVWLKLTTTQQSGTGGGDITSNKQKKYLLCYECREKLRVMYQDRPDKFIDDVIPRALKTSVTQQRPESIFEEG